MAPKTKPTTSEPKDLVDGVSILPAVKTRSRSRPMTMINTSNNNSATSTSVSSPPTNSTSPSTVVATTTNNNTSTTQQPSPPNAAFQMPMIQGFQQPFSMLSSQQTGNPRQAAGLSPEHLMAIKNIHSQGNVGEEGMRQIHGLSPDMENPGGNFSPWMVANGDFRMSPMAQMMQLNGMPPIHARGPASMYNHVSERNKFESSFLEQLPSNETSPNNNHNNPQGAIIPPAFEIRNNNNDNNNNSNTSSTVDNSSEAVASLVALTTHRSLPFGHGNNSNNNNNDADPPPPPLNSSVSTNKKGSKNLAGKSKISPKKKRMNANEEERKEKRREQNRRNAAKCRQRKIDKVSELSQILTTLQEENQQLRSTHDDMEEKLRRWQSKTLPV